MKEVTDPAILAAFQQQNQQQAVTDPAVLAAFGIQPQHETNYIGAAWQGAKNMGAQMLDTGAVIGGAFPTIADNVETWATGVPTTARSDSYFQDVVMDGTQPMVEATQLNPNASTGEKVAFGLGNVAAALPTMLLSAPLAIGSKVPAALGMVAKGAAAMQPLAITGAVQESKRGIEAGVPIEEMGSVAVAKYLGTTAMGAVPVAAAGNMMTRGLTGAGLGVATGAAETALTNAAYGDAHQNMQTDIFNADDMTVNGALGAVLGAALGKRGNSTGNKTKADVEEETTLRGEGEQQAPLALPAPENQPIQGQVVDPPIANNPFAALEAPKQTSRVMPDGTIQQGTEADIKQGAAIDVSVGNQLLGLQQIFQNEAAIARQANAKNPLRNALPDNTVKPKALEAPRTVAASVTPDGVVKPVTQAEAWLNAQPAKPDTTGSREQQNAIHGRTNTSQLPPSSQANPFMDIMGGAEQFSPQAVETKRIAAEKQSAADAAMLKKQERSQRAVEAAKKRKQVSSADSLDVFVRKMGGVNDGDFAKAFHTKETGNKGADTHGALTRYNGKSADTMAEYAHEAGYIQERTPQALYDALELEINQGVKQHTPEQTQDQAEQDYNKAQMEGEPDIRPAVKSKTGLVSDITKAAGRDTSYPEIPFSRKQEEGLSLGDVKFSREDHNSVPRASEELRSIIMDVKVRSVRSDEIMVKGSFTDLPVEIQKYADNEGHDGSDVNGVFHKGKVYLIMDNLARSKDVRAATEETIFHEFVHADVSAMFGKDMGVFLNHLYKRIGGDKGMESIAKARNIDLSVYKKANEEAGYSMNVRHKILMDELLAHIGQVRPDLKAKVKTIIGHIRNWLRKKGLKYLAEYGETDLLSLISTARKQAMRGKEGETRFIRNAASDKQLRAPNGKFDAGNDDIRFSRSAAKSEEAEVKANYKATKEAVSDYVGGKKDGMAKVAGAFWERLFYKPAQVVRDYGVEHARIIADKFLAEDRHEKRTTDNPDLMTQRAFELGKFVKRLQDAIEPLSNRFVMFDRDATGLIRGLPSADNMKIIRALRTGKVPVRIAKEAQALRDLLNDVRQYAINAGLDIGELANYFPRVYDVERISKNKDKFIKFLEKNGYDNAAAQRTMHKIINSEGSPELYGDDADRIAVNDAGDVFNPRAKGKEGGASKQSYEKLRSVDIDEALLEKWLVNDIQAVLTQHINNVVRRAEYARRFGDKESLLNADVRKMVDELEKSDRQSEVKKAVRDVYDMADAAMGKYKPIENEAWRNGNRRLSDAMVMIHLPLVAFSSIPEFLAPIVHGGRYAVVPILKAAVVHGLNEGANSIAKMIIGKRLWSKSEWTESAEQMGLITQAALAQAVQARMGHRTGKWTNRFIRATMLEQMTGLQKVMANETFKAMMKSHAKNLEKGVTGKKREQILQDIRDYGLSESQVKAWAKTGEGEAELRMAAVAFVNKVITTPNEANTPLHVQNPHFAQLMLFKRFITIFSNTFLKRMLQQSTRGKTTEAKMQGLIGAVLMMGAAYAAQSLRDDVKWGEEGSPFRKKDEVGKRMVDAFDRAGFSGSATWLYAVVNPYRFGYTDKTSQRLFNLMGPAIGDATKTWDAFALTPKSKRKAAQKQGRQLSKLLPVVNAMEKTRKPFEKAFADILHR